MVLLVMDGPESRALQSLDSFWFFANIFSRKNPMVVGAADRNSGDRDKEHSLVEAEEVLSAKDPKPISPIIQIEQNGSAIGSPMCLKCGGTELVEEVETRSGEKRRCKSRSRSHRRREIFGVLDFGSGGAKEGSWLLLDEVERYSQSPSPSPRKGGQNLPPLNVNDGTAMKEHLKSWAYAVACTVK